MRNKMLSPRMEKWLESRLWNLKMSGEKLDTEIVIGELENIFYLNVKSRARRDKIKKLIRTVSFRIAKRYKRYNEKIEKSANALMVSEKMVRRWMNMGLDIGHRYNRIWMKIIRERDLLKDCGGVIDEEQIPLDINVSLPIGEGQNMKKV